MLKLKLIIAGTRSYEDYDKMKEYVLNYLFELYKKGFSYRLEHIEIVSGMADGADMLGVRFACENSIKLHQFPANWVSYGKAAGHIRNKKMANIGDALIVFWDGKSTGTKSMIDIAEKKGMLMNVVKYKWDVNDNSYTYE